MTYTNLLNKFLFLFIGCGKVNEMKNKIIKVWNLSPSSLGMWFNSQLMFYYSYLSDEEPDTEVVQCYGISGTLVHSSLEHYHEHKDRNLTNDYFIKEWDRLNLDNLLGLNGKPLSKMQYHQAMLHGMDLIDNKYEIIETEMAINLPFRDGTNTKGFIDVVCKENGVKKIVDWKTSASKDSGENFKRQVLFYAWLYYKKTGELIHNASIEYLKLKSSSDFVFSEDDIINFDINVLIPVWNEIQSKGYNKRNYDLGDWDSPFCQYKKKCYQEKLIRENVGAIQCYRERNRLVFKNGLEENLKRFLDHYFSYFVKGRHFVESFKKRVWDGRRTFFKKDSLPYAFVWKVQELLEVYNKRFGTTFWLNIEDYRNQSVVNKIYDTKFKDSDIVLRPYQKEAIQQSIQKKIGIIYIGTGGGKSLLSADLIKKINRRTLFLVNRVELVRQTKEEFERYLGVEIGEMSEGNLDISKQITVASIQTIVSILKRKNEDCKKLKMYLYNVTCCIADESQNVKDSGMYEDISNQLVNIEYMLGLSGSPFRSDNTTLDMNSLVGFIIYKKSTKELEEEGWILPTKTYFLSTPQNDGTETGKYHEDYQTFITNNNLRNNIIKDVVSSYKDKKKILVLVKSIEHGELLEELIPDSFFLYGSTPKKQRKEMFNKFKHENGLVMISMVSIFGTGVDIPDLDIVINASAFGSDISSIQTIGRTKRRSEGKKHGIFIDFLDEGIYQPMSRKRIKMLEEFGNPVEKIHHIEWNLMEIE